jgi:hypothetical protein
MDGSMTPVICLGSGEYRQEFSPAPGDGGPWSLLRALGACLRDLALDAGRLWSPAESDELVGSRASEKDFDVVCAECGGLSECECNAAINAEATMTAGTVTGLAALAPAVPVSVSPVGVSAIEVGASDPDRALRIASRLGVLVACEHQMVAQRSGIWRALSALRPAASASLRRAIERHWIDSRPADSAVHQP